MSIFFHLQQLRMAIYVQISEKSTRLADIKDLTSFNPSENENEEGEKQKPIKVPKTQWMGVKTRRMEWRERTQRLIPPDTLVSLPEIAYDQEKGACFYCCEVRIGCVGCYRGSHPMCDVYLPSHPKESGPFPLKDLDFRVNCHFFHEGSIGWQNQKKHTCQCDYWDGKYKRFPYWKVLPRDHPQFQEILMQLLRVQMKKWIRKEDKRGGGKSGGGFGAPWRKAEFFRRNLSSGSEVDDSSEIELASDDVTPIIPEELQNSDIHLCQSCHHWFRLLHPDLAQDFHKRSTYELSWIQWLEEHEHLLDFDDEALKQKVQSSIPPHNEELDSDK